MPSRALGPNRSRKPPMFYDVRRMSCMTKTLIALLGLTLASSLVAGSDIAPAKDQIASSVLAAPEDRRAEAAVLGYSPVGKLVTLREGSNDLICLADDPRNDNFSVACYHKDLEPYMARGRELIAQGITGKQRNAIRWKEIADGKLEMPREARALYVLTGSGFDAVAGEVTDPYLRWVIYKPYATPESTGLSTTATPGGPWLMSAGTAGAHIMINPPKPRKK